MRRPAARRAATLAAPRCRRRLVDGVGDQVEVPGGHLGTGALDGGQDHPDGDRDERQPGDQADRIAKRDRDQGGHRALGRDDRRDDRDLADAQRRVGQLQPDDVAGPREEEEREGRWRDRRWRRAHDRDRQADDDADDHDPGQHDPRTEHPAGARRAERGGGPQRGGTEAREDRGHGGSVEGPRARRPSRVAG